MILDSKEQLFEKYVANRQQLYGKNFFTEQYIFDRIQKAQNNITNTYNKFLSESAEKFNNPRIGFQSLVYNNFSTIADDIIDYAIYLWRTTDSNEALLNGIYTYGRIYYLGSITMPFAGSTDAYHSRVLLLTAAGNDHQLFQAYLRAIPGPPTVGNLMLKSLAIGLYALIDDDKNRKEDAIIFLTNALQKKVLTQWDRAVVSSIIAILTLNRTQFSQSLQIVLDFHAKSFLTRGLLFHISLPAHALYNFAYFLFEKAGLEPPIEPEHRYWDSSFWHLVRESKQQREYIVDIRSVSPVLANLMDTLPASLNFNELISS